jgi:diguanylate cyclase (GGDEF)-like protein/PAS domain S-box-containing protein
MRFSKSIPELGKILQIWKIAVSDRRSLSVALCVVLAVPNVLSLCAVILLHGDRYTNAPIVCAVLLWNIFLALSIGRQILEDQTSISKNRVLFRRFQNTTKYFESILQDTSDMIISLDKDYYIFKFNSGAESHFGYSQEEILGKPFEKLFLNPEDKEKMHLPVKSGVKSASAEISMRTKTGQKIVVSMCMSKMRDGGFVVTAQDITEKKYLEEQLQQKSDQLNRLAITDDLTGLYNSRHFYHVIKSELSRLKRHAGRKLAVIYMDVDRFKEYNDTEGHQMGDNVLRSLGEVINVCIRKDVDSGFRYGGDEFVIVLPDTSVEQAKYAAERIQKQFGAFKFGETSLSVGIAEASDDDDEKSLVHKADFAMYASKKGGKNRITISDGEVSSIKD